MIQEDRLQFILDILKENKRTTLEHIADELDVSVSTIRRDVHLMVKRGLAQHLRGGVIIPKNDLRFAHHSDVHKRLQETVDAKKSIANAVASCITGNETVFLGGGSTMVYIAQKLASKDPLTIVTLSLLVAQELTSYNQHRVIMLGGELNHQELVFYGILTDSALNQLRVDTAIISPGAVNANDGIMTEELYSVSSLRKVIENAKRYIIVVHHSKLNQISTAYLSELTRVDILIVDNDPSLGKQHKSLIDEIQAMGIKIIIAS